MFHLCWWSKVRIPGDSLDAQTFYSKKQSTSFYSFLSKLPAKYSGVDKDYQQHGDQTIDEEVEVSQINLYETKKNFYIHTFTVFFYNKFLPSHKWSSDEMMLEQFPEVRYIDYIIQHFLYFLSFSVKSYHK